MCIFYMDWNDEQGDNQASNGKALTAAMYVSKMVKGLKDVSGLNNPLRGIFSPKDLYRIS